MSKGERVTQVIRIAAFVISLLLWAGSVIFSVDGLGAVFGVSFAEKGLAKKK